MNAVHIPMALKDWIEKHKEKEYGLMVFLSRGDLENWVCAHGYTLHVQKGTWQIIPIWLLAQRKDTREEDTEDCWSCLWCKTINADEQEVCTGCGAEREKADEDYEEKNEGRERKNGIQELEMEG